MLPAYQNLERWSSLQVMNADSTGEWATCLIKLEWQDGTGGCFSPVLMSKHPSAKFLSSTYKTISIKKILTSTYCNLLYDWILLDSSFRAFELDSQVPKSATLKLITPNSSKLPFRRSHNCTLLSFPAVRIVLESDLNVALTTYIHHLNSNS